MSDFKSKNEQITMLTEELADTRDALADLIDIIDAAGLLHLSNGVQLGPTAWYVKALTRLDYARQFTGREQDKPRPVPPHGSGP